MCLKCGFFVNFAGTDERVGTFEGKCFSFICSNVYKYSFSIRIYDILAEQFSHVLHVFFVYMWNYYKQVPWP